MHTGSPAGRVIYQSSTLWQAGNGKNPTKIPIFYHFSIFRQILLILRYHDSTKTPALVASSQH